MSQPDWQKSSFSGEESNCVEIRAGLDLVELRESDDSDVIIRTTPATFAALLAAITAGELDHHA
ncbi:DUF397 domain-containing protein [Kitasatospora sp. NPDC097605]|uniref:DUF397 domain-containing protein n=1 Tax=Kitasatospora sp. NPDC097605 TaxID=3157226 RepID=UPI00331C79E6